MLVASEVKMSGSEKESEWNRSTRNNNFVRTKDLKLVTREFHFVVVLIRPIDVFVVVFPFSLPSPLSSI